MKYGTAEYCLNEAKKEIDKALTKIASVREEVGTIMEVKKVPSFSSFSLSHYYQTVGYKSFNPLFLSHVEFAWTKASKAVETCLADIESIHAANAAAIANNFATRKKICDFMGTIGIPETYLSYELKTPRHKVRQSITKSAGYKNDIDRCIPVSDGYESAKRGCTDAQARLKKEYDTLIAAITKAEKEAEKASKEKESLMELARFQVKYETTGIWYDILNIILSKDKYLWLGHYLLKNREDWNDGPDYAATGLRGFSIEDSADQMIYNEILGLIDDWDGDGRCFRDCKYNYDHLFSLVKDQKLIEDYNAVIGKLS